MNKGSSGIYDRCLEKTPEQLFIGMLRREFELSPAASLGILRWLTHITPNDDRWNFLRIAAQTSAIWGEYKLNETKAWCFVF